MCQISQSGHVINNSGRLLSGTVSFCLEIRSSTHICQKNVQREKFILLLHLKSNQSAMKNLMKLEEHVIAAATSTL